MRLSSLLPNPLLLTLLTLLPLTTWAADDVGSSGTQRSANGDPIGQQLDVIGYRYTRDSDGDYRLTFSLDGDRTQLVYVLAATEKFGTHSIREIWAPAYRAPGGRIPEDIANRLLEDSQASKLGSWVKQGDMAVFVVKIPADASAQQLEDALDAAMRSADQMEAALTPDRDEF